MEQYLTLTVITDDRPGIVEKIAKVVLLNQGSWLESNMSRLAGKFAGVLLVKTSQNNQANLLRDLKEPDLNGDASQFKGIFMRNLAYLHSFDPKENYKDFILLNADSIWNLARNKETNEIGVVWNSFSDRADASCQSSALDAFNAALIVTN